MTDIGRQIAAARHAKNMTQDEVAERMHISRQTLSHWEQGRNKPDVESLFRLSEILECAFDLESEGTEPAPPEAEAPAPQNSRSKRALLIAVPAVLAAALLLAFLPRLLVKKAPAEIEISASEGDPLPCVVDEAFSMGHGWIFSFHFRELAGTSFKAETLALDVLGSNGILTTANYNPAEEWNGHTDIPANGVRDLYGGVSLPGVQGLRMVLSGKDALGNELTFSREFGLQPYTEE